MTKRVLYCKNCGKRKLFILSAVLNNDEIISCIHGCGASYIKKSGSFVFEQYMKGETDG